MAEEKYVLKMDQISKDYFGNQVLNNVELYVKPGEIHALMGENGAGKSTLMNILFGMPVIHNTGGFQGKVEIAGESIVIESPSMAMEQGIGMVHQEFMLIPGFTVTENIKVGREITNPSLLSKIFGKNLETLDMDQMANHSRKALGDIGLSIEEYVKVAGLPIGYMQFIEIAREIDKTGIKLLVFDEPTAVLTESEAERLLEIMKLIASRGIAIIFISHRLDEIMNVCDTVTILRDGEFVIRKAIKDTSVVEIAQLMIGRKVEKMVDKDDSERHFDPEHIALELVNFHVDMPGEEVKGLELAIYEGEIFGIGGLAGQGKIGISNGLMGLFPSTGQAIVHGETLNLDQLGNALNHQMAFVSEDRRGIGLLLGESIERNIVFSALQTNKEYLHHFGPFSLYNKAEARKHAEKMINLLDIRCTGPDQVAGSLSGGNQQKVCLARALTLNPKVLIVSEPTRGIDIGAKKLVLEHLVKLNRDQGMTIVVISSELVELRSIADRIAIVSDGKINRIMRPDDSDAAFGLAMSGMKVEDL